MNRSEEDIPLILKEWLMDQGCWDEYIYNYLNVKHANPVRIHGVSVDKDDLRWYTINTFQWRLTEESITFWCDIHNKWADYYESL